MVGLITTYTNRSVSPHKTYRSLAKQLDRTIRSAHNHRHSLAVTTKTQRLMGGAKKQNTHLPVELQQVQYFILYFLTMLVVQIQADNSLQTDHTDSPLQL